MGLQRPEYSDVRGLILETLQRGFQPLWVTPDDLLVTRIRNSLAGVTVQTSGRIWHTDGSVGEFTYSDVPTSDRAVNNFTRQLEYGWLVSVSATAAGTLPNRGQTLVSLHVARPPAASFTSKWFLAQDYLTGLNAVLFPYPRVVAGIEGPGRLISFAIGNPALGADWTATVPTGARWRLHGGTATLVTGIGGLSRLPILTVDDGVNKILGIPEIPSAAQGASATLVYELNIGDTRNLQVATTEFEGLMPADLVMLAGWRIRMVTGGITATDQWSAIRLLVEEWLED